MKHIKLFEDMESIQYRSLINYEMINDIKDMALEYLDDGFSLRVVITNSENKEVYDLWYDHKYNIDTYLRGSIKKSFFISTKLTYTVYLLKGYNNGMAGVHSPKESKELVKRIKLAYPKERIKLFV